MPRSSHGPACRCPEPTADDGLLAYTVDCAHYEQLARALKAIARKPKTAVLRVLTTDPEPPSNLVDLAAPVCDGSLVCDCPECVQDRAERVKKGIRRVRQPWEAKAA